MGARQHVSTALVTVECFALGFARVPAAGQTLLESLQLSRGGAVAAAQFVAVVNARTGRLSEQTLLTANGVEYRIDSRLLIADPVRPDDQPRGQCASCGTEAAYVWDGSQFTPVGEGPHPHLSGGRPWPTP